MDKNKMDSLLNDLQQLKDELTDKAKLGTGEAQKELEKLEPLYNDLKEKTSKIADVAGDTASEIKAATELGIDAGSTKDIQIALELAAEQLKNSYSKIKDIITD